MVLLYEFMYLGFISDMNLNVITLTPYIIPFRLLHFNFLKLWNHLIQHERNLVSLIGQGKYDEEKEISLKGKTNILSTYIPSQKSMRYVIMHFI